MALRGIWNLKGKIPVEAKVVVTNHAGGKRAGQYTGLVEIQDPEGEVVLDTTNVTAPYVEGVPGDRLCYWALQYRNPKLSSGSVNAGDPPRALIQALQAEDAKAEAERREIAARETLKQAQEERATLLKTT